MELSQLTAISPLDGRYGGKTQALRSSVSEYGLIHARVRVEIEWFIFLATTARLPELSKVKAPQISLLQNWLTNFDTSYAASVKTLEATTNHDVKAVEYLIKNFIESTQDEVLLASIEYVHFGCTSEDINNLADRKSVV